MILEFMVTIVVIHNGNIGCAILGLLSNMSVDLYLQIFLIETSDRRH
ncbi:hypothetical protein DFA_03673 [Cavenderia fasciculata]|uniref:Transmembrane protein n=1 Tax=Cavenderia fasciculata TaxID=261658 RepID=F4Q1N6_CACFS|nr:uncharacterized protein DFA_03673 [Cavenderia fasciculata]EGG18186.1 hypothetical protein DFA_03673 [Cavenderia fasciculata]|eukprot:XP_004357009.1 hypothetical protein DFA_03673 [Cavenderia fasciculata]